MSRRTGARVAQKMIKAGDLRRNQVHLGHFGGLLRSAPRIGPFWRAPCGCLRLQDTLGRRLRTSHFQLAATQPHRQPQHLVKTRAHYNNVCAFRTCRPHHLVMPTTYHQPASEMPNPPSRRHQVTLKPAPSHFLVYGMTGELFSHPSRDKNAFCIFKLC
jgi:hypothetical protein